MAGTRSQNISEDEFSEDEFVSEIASDDDAAEEKHVLALHDKDSDEEDLEQLVFGNRSSFRDNLFKSDGYSAREDAGGRAAPSKDEDTAGLEGVEDVDLFMIDAGPTSAAPRQPSAAGPTAAADPNAPVWEDSDDERLAISLADNTRLRKLRVTEAEDVISGTEYTRRLRQQYQRLNPVPAWVKDAQGRPSKRRWRSAAAAASDGSSGGSGSDDGGSDSDSDGGDVSAQPLEAFLRDVNNLAGGTNRRRQLRPEIIDIQRLREIPDKHLAAVECLSFHPRFPVLLSASTSSVLMLHHVAPDAQPTPNPQLTSVQVKGVDIRRAAFVYPQGDRVLIGGRRKYFHGWDLRSGVVHKVSHVSGHRLEHKTMERFRTSPCGRYMAIAASTRKGGGVINVLSAATMQWVAAARLAARNGIADFAWWSTGEGMTILGRDGQVGEWSMERRGFLGVWRDDGCIGGIVLALGGHQGPAAIGEDRWVAVGSSSGITNIYDRHELLSTDKAAAVAAAAEEEGDAGASFSIKETPTPTRVFEQLVTPVTVLEFSPDGQLLAFGSRQKKDALRLAHLPSCTVYRNWPTAQTPLGRITTVAFGRDSNVLAVGNDAGKIRLWAIRN
ncbi:putative U3 small nucleolar RNA-associated protein 18 [Escovopsis weberi]|uniref:Putative U3 small nucleolar RNA-associated protein 18 n=1 Tax=Escovopsis weberi TaxID=150374 RepID=A0A0M8MZK7_ESCWE|nr:putative U3 small nucleolar RNA-associated protein 18 [Escovopsis weberi]